MTTNDHESRAFEDERIDVLHSYRLLNGERDDACDRITALAAGYFDVPVAFLTLVDRDHAWVKSAHGIAVERIARSAGFSTNVVANGELFVVEDARRDPRTAEHPFVKGEPRLGFYAAAPLVTAEGFRLGALGVLSQEPRAFTGEDRETLQRFAQTAVDLMDLRLCIGKALESFSTAFREGDADHLVTVCAWTRKVMVNGDWLTFEEFLTRELGYSVTHGIHPDAMHQIIREVE